MAAAASSWVEKMLQLTQRTSAPRATRVSMSTAVWIVMCSEPMIRAPARGWASVYSARVDIRPGISCSASSISLRPKAGEAGCRRPCNQCSCTSSLIGGCGAAPGAPSWSRTPAAGPRALGNDSDGTGFGRFAHDKRGVLDKRLLESRICASRRLRHGSACPLACSATARTWGFCRPSGSGRAAGVVPPLRGAPPVRGVPLPGPLRTGPGIASTPRMTWATIAAALRLEQRYDITPAALAFGLRVLTEPSVRQPSLTWLRTARSRDPGLARSTSRRSAPCAGSALPLKR